MTNLPSPRLYSVPYLNAHGEPNVRYYTTWARADQFATYLRSKFGQRVDIYSAAVEWEVAQ